jgi:hypothetical protein
MISSEMAPLNLRLGEVTRQLKRILGLLSGSFPELRFSFRSRKRGRVHAVSMAMVPPPVLRPSLYLDEKGLTDEEVDEVFADAPAEHKQGLRLVSLYGNRLTRIPPAVLDMTGLTRLNLIGNPIRVLAPEIGRLVGLKRLYIERCELSTLPMEISQLTRLTALFFNNNEICTLPPLIEVRALKFCSLSLTTHHSSSIWRCFGHGTICFPNTCHETTATWSWQKRASEAARTRCNCICARSRPISSPGPRKQCCSFWRQTSLQRAARLRRFRVRWQFGLCKVCVALAIQRAVGACVLRALGAEKEEKEKGQRQQEAASQEGAQAGHGDQGVRRRESDEMTNVISCTTGWMLLELPCPRSKHAQAVPSSAFWSGVQSYAVWENTKNTDGSAHHRSRRER